MTPLDHYPAIDLGPLMKGLVIGGLGIFHVFLAQFAIGGGMLLCYLQWRHMRGVCQLARRFTDDYFKMLVLVSFVLGAVTGVAMWFTSIQISPRTIGTMVLEFHWVWATEWTFFCLEVVAGYLFYRYGPRPPRSRRWPPARSSMPCPGLRGRSGRAWWPSVPVRWPSCWPCRLSGPGIWAPCPPTAAAGPQGAACR